MWKDDALCIAQEHCCLPTAPEWKELKAQFQKRGYRYESQTQRKEQGARKKGFVVGCAVRRLP